MKGGRRHGNCCSLGACSRGAHGQVGAPSSYRDKDCTEQGSILPSAAMMRAAAILCAVAASCVRADKASFDCAMRGLAVEFAAHANPNLSAAALGRIADALNGAPEKTAGCNVSVRSARIRGVRRG